MRIFMQKQKILAFRTKTVFFGYFRTGIRKSHFHIWNQRPRICLIVTYGAKWKSLNLGPKMTDLHIFRVELENTIVLFEICVLKFVLLQSLVQNQKTWKKRKCLNLGPKMHYLGILGKNLKTILSYLKSKPRISLIAKFREKPKVPKFGTKNAWFVYFWTGIWKYYYHIWNVRPQNCVVAKFGAKLKIFQFGTKNT